MSKIGRKAIDVNNVQVEVKGREIHYKGQKASGVYTLPADLIAQVEDKKLFIKPAKQSHNRSINQEWGLNRALLANAIKGVDAGFEKQVQINGLGFKAALAGSKIVFSLGFSHKIDFDLPKEVTLEIDKTGQMLTFKSSNKELLGHVCSMVKALRPPEPYKGTGIKFATETIARKAGKTKAAA